MSPSWLERFPNLQAVTDPVGRGVLAAAQELTVPAGTTVFHVGDACRHYLLVLDGSVRVQQVAHNGREIVLYRVQEGESCVLTTSCLLGHDRYVAEGVTETEVRAVAIPAGRFLEGIESSPGFRRFVFEGYGQRIADLMLLIEDIVFGRVDVRLAKRLLSLADAEGVVRLTHQALAAEIGSAREVVSRQLKEFERRELIALGRGAIELRDRAALGRLAEL